MEFIFTFILLIFVLFFLSRQLTSTIHLFFYDISKSETISTNILAILFFPGVVIHELAHFFAAKILNVHTGKIEFIPKREGNYVKLGSVSLARTNMLSEFLIGIAPIIVGISAILTITYFVINNFLGVPTFFIPIAVFVIFVISNTMYSSRRDLEAALPFLVFIISVIVVLLVLGVKVPNIEIKWFSEVDLRSIFYTASKYLLIPVIIDLIVIAVLRILRRVW